MSGISSTRRNVDDKETGSIPAPRSAADAFRVSDEQVANARLVVAKNAQSTEDLREMLDMLGLISSSPDQPPPVSR
ncbi:hypothetical protein EV383_0530 [Pseudonocardia sediminis]|uniref:Uncharacterized protein n=1 Tax=Pseudonocardia sediminis TaxID=1397368 RepID=A0A4Q7UQ19_PSEST|nr:hypothetical protein [Pseudonocardia sediminis]RZT83715.1 hypothetical protein EV383_0530 [Pseudonocardia sediminis]